jgi:hypothetical protein
MAKTVTHVKTKTYTRINLIKAQVEIALCRTTDMSMETIMNSILAGIDKHWISKVHVYGFDSENLCRAQLSMEIDWDEHDVQIAKGNTTVIIDDDGRKWRDNTVIELNKAISLFNDYVGEYSLKTKCYTVYAPGVDREEANRILNRVPAKPIKWKDKADGFVSDIPEIKELRVGFYCVD